MESFKQRGLSYLVNKYGNISGKSKKWVDKKLKEEAEQDIASLNTEPQIRLADLEG